MIDRVTKLRWRRRLRKSRRHVEDIGVLADDLTQRHLVKRLSRLWEVRRFVSTWILLIVILTGTTAAQIKGLDKHYKSLQPAPGGIFTEGILGNFTTVNPLYVANPVDNAVSKLLFASLLKYDANNALTGDLAESWTIDPAEKLYTIVLKPDLKWHDGLPLTAADVVFTYQVIQNPDAKSPLNPSWTGIKVIAKDDRTITFELPNTLSPFMHSLTNGIIPKHILEGIPPSQLRSISFNTSAPVGSGPFKWETLETTNSEDPSAREEYIGLVANENYHFGKPKLSKFVIRSFREELRLVDSFARQELQAAAGLQSVPEKLKKNADILDQSMPLTSEVLVFFKTNQEVLKSSAIRRALTAAIDPSLILSRLDYPTTLARGPLLKKQVGYNSGLVQTKNFEQANTLLDQEGYAKDPVTGFRYKGGSQLTFKLTSQNTKEYQAVAESLKEQWQKIGANVELALQPEQDIQTSLANHNYDALLYGISIGPDPDVFAYWHSSQFDLRSPTRLNLSEYHNDKADRALEAGRTRSDPAIRDAKYKPFLEAWLADAPAIALYQPRYLYLTYKPFYGSLPSTINNATGRYAYVENWMIRQERSNK